MSLSNRIYDAISVVFSMHQKDLFCLQLQMAEQTNLRSHLSELLVWEKLNYDVSVVIRNANGRGFMQVGY
jgi:hypothetical protein